MFPLDFWKVLLQPRVLVKNPQSDRATQAGGPRRPPHPWGPPLLGAFNSCPLHVHGPQEMTRGLTASMHTRHLRVPKLGRLPWNLATPEALGYSTGKKNKLRNSTPIINSHLIFLSPSRRHLLGVEQFGADMALTPSNHYRSPF